ncbi:MAG: SIMPL domain-containing protein [Desulfobulbaceae bacterium]|uniref:SIMPL domain-containing protein n=1 Tax=Candidatus Desulfobia pelagia TaxID=2841692 RepID=A0A8J6NE31_9BACT|nr:SIMPL domain-containing protein [Candidatus Desulfobia pelagia]
MKNLSFLNIIFFLLAGIAHAEALPNEPHIVVSGTHEISAVPDILRMSLDINEVGRDVAEARASVEERSELLLQALKSLGVKKKDITSARLQITPHYNWSNKAQIYTGTEVSRVIEVILRDLAQYDEMVRAIIDARVARINNTSLESTENKELRALALQGAVADAREKAVLLVKNFPEQVGGVYSISASPSPGGFRPARYQVAEFAKRESFEPGVIQISETVQVVFYLMK